MIIFEAKNDTSKPQIAVVGCLHGNETLGMDLLEAVAKRPADFDNLLIILANMPAYHQDTRYIEQDLNRSFPGSAEGNKEEKLAAEIMKLVGGADRLIDIHTTTSPGFEAAVISGELNATKQDSIAAFNLSKIAIMKEAILAKSLIGNSNNAISVEYGVEVAKDPELVQQMVSAILQLQSDKGRDQEFNAELYDVAGTIPRDDSAPAELRNFEYSKEIDGYPFIIDEQHYVDIRGFLLKNKRQKSF